MDIELHIARRLCPALELPPDQTGTLAGALVRPPTPAHGDLALPCFGFARSLRRSPQQIAASLAGKLEPDEVIAGAEAAGPYLNIRLNRPAVTASVLGDVLADPGAYGRRDLGRGGVVVLDFSAPNIAKPFHFGHLRSTNLGAILGRLLEHMGYRVFRKNYLGDWGTQFGFVIYAWQRWGDEWALEKGAIDYLVSLYIRAYQESEGDPGVREQARELFRRLEQGDPDIRALWARFRELSLAGFMDTYRRLGVSFDSYDGEAAINPQVRPIIERFQRAGVAVQSEGALVVEVSDVIGREIAPCMLQKSDGASTYAARDCAEALDRFERHGFVANIYVASRQEDHFAQVFAALGKLAEAEGWRENWAQRCENISFGFVRGMSTRKGEAVWLSDVLDEARDRARRVRTQKAAQNPQGFPELLGADLDEVSEAVGQAALLYFDVSSRRMSDISFDWNTVLQFEGNTGPYLQYTHARIGGIFRKTGQVASGDLAEIAPLLENEEEWQLVLHLRAYADTLERACVHREPFELANYLYALCSLVNTFYNRHKVLGTGPGLERARLALLGATQAVLAGGLRLLGIRPLDRM
ncbi:MAG: arginine--tRNA ligase [Chromatiales bacterium]|nr:arginine--tRNA ligase [Chromatiales bacterium]